MEYKRLTKNAVYMGLVKRLAKQYGVEIKE